jgi:hypothetical protein
MTEEESNKSVLPEPPSFTEEQLRNCAETGDYRLILFEWYKFVGSLSIIVALIKWASPAFRKITKQHYYVLVGLLNRCARLMLANVALSHEGVLGETTAIIDRCIFESAVKIAWLAKSRQQENFDRYFSDGLKTELEFRALINQNVVDRNGEEFAIERRMLRSIERTLEASGLEETQITSAKKLPDLAFMISAIGLDRLSYVIGQRIGSHHVHGTWPSLLSHYLDEDEESAIIRFRPRDHNCPTHVNQYMYVPLVVLRALSSYVEYVLGEEATVFLELFQTTEDKIFKVYTESLGGDLEN